MNGVIYGNITNMTPLYNFIDDSYFAKIIIDMLLCKVANADKI